MSLYKCPKCKSKMDETYHCENCGFDLPISERVTKVEVERLFWISLLLYLFTYFVLSGVVKGIAYLVVIILTSIPYFKARRIGMGLLALFPLTTLIVLIIGVISSATGSFKDHDKNYIR